MRQPLARVRWRGALGPLALAGSALLGHSHAQQQNTPTASCRSLPGHAGRVGAVGFRPPHVVAPAAAYRLSACCFSLLAPSCFRLTTASL
jgi:hypothetical protein